MRKETKKERLWRRQSEVLRDPLEIISNNFEQSGLYSESLKFKIQGVFLEILKEKKVKSSYY